MTEVAEIDYREAYEKEHVRCADLSDRVVLLESQAEDLQFQLDRIRQNKLWKISKPARSLFHFLAGQDGELRNRKLSHSGAGGRSA